MRYPQPRTARGPPEAARPAQALATASDIVPGGAGGTALTMLGLYTWRINNADRILRALSDENDPDDEDGSTARSFQD